MGRTAIVLGLITLNMLGFILLYERDTLSTAEREGRKGRVLQEFIRDRVDKLEVQRQSERVVLARTKSGSHDEFSDWKLMEPLAAEADQEAVEDVMAELEWLHALRSIQKVSDSDRESFKLDTPRLRIWFSVGDRRTGLAIGGEEPKGQGVYVQVVGEPDVHVVAHHVVEAFDHSADHYHTKQLYDLLVPAMVHSFRLQTGDRTALVKREEDGWWVTAPERVRADESQVDAFLRSLTPLRATRYVAAAADAGDSKYGLKPAVATAHIEVDWGSDQAGRDNSGSDKAPGSVRMLELSIGSPCEGHPNEYYFRAGADQPVVCVDAAAVQILQLTADDLWEKRAATADEFNVARVALHAGERRVVLTRQQDTWQRELHALGKTRKSRVEPDVVAGWLQQLRKLRATAHESANDAVLLERGLRKPAAELRLLDDAGETLQTLSLGLTSGHSVYARRGDDPSILLFSDELLPLLDPSAEPFAEPAADR